MSLTLHIQLLGGFVLTCNSRVIAEIATERQQALISCVNRKHSI
jgi:hypothetical protein